MRYATARYRQKMQDVTYRIYDTDCSQAIAHNTAQQNGGSYLKTRFADVLMPKEEINAEKVISDVIKKAGLEVI